MNSEHERPLAGSAGTSPSTPSAGITSSPYALPSSGPEDAGELEQRLREAQEERARLWEEVHRLRAERRDVEYYEQLANRVTSSASWKVTAPLRLAKTLRMRIQRKLEQRPS